MRRALSAVGFVATSLVGLVAVSAAGARHPRHAASAAAAPVAPPPGNGVGYPGVVPGESNPPPRPVRPGTKPPTVTWPGFQMTPQGSRVFLEMTAPAPYDVQQKDNQVVVTLRGARLHLRNNQRPLDTQFFATPVTRAQAEKMAGGVRLVIDLREPATPSVHVEPGPNGYSFLFVDFPPPSSGQPALANPPAAASPPASPSPPAPASQPGAGESSAFPQ